MKKIDTSKWKEFVVGDLFDIHPTKAYKRINIELFEENGTNPVVVNTGFNNGVGGYANLDCTEKAGTITFTDTAAKSTDSFFYQEKEDSDDQPSRLPLQSDEDISLSPDAIHYHL